MLSLLYKRVEYAADTERTCQEVLLHFLSEPIIWCVLTRHLINEQRGQEWQTAGGG